MAKTLVEQYTDIRAKLVEKENAAKKDVINIITDLKPIMKQLEDIQAELVPGEFAFNQIGHIVTVMDAVKTSFHTPEMAVPAPGTAPFIQPQQHEAPAE